MFRRYHGSPRDREERREQLAARVLRQRDTCRCKTAIHDGANRQSAGRKRAEGDIDDSLAKTTSQRRSRRGFSDRLYRTLSRAAVVSRS